MSRLLLYADLSPSWPWLWDALRANSQSLQQHNIACPECFWETFLRNKYVVGKKVASLLKSLDKGSDVLIKGLPVNPAIYRALAQYLQNDPRLAGHDIQLLLIIGRPLYAFEQRYRFLGADMRLTDVLTLVRQYVGIASLVHELQQCWGRSHVTLISDVSGSPVSKWDAALAEQLFSWLGCPPPQIPSHLPFTPLVLASWEGRRLASTAEVRYNAWPPLDTGVFMDCLAALDQQWEPAAASPRKYRLLLQRNSLDIIPDLESLLALKPGSLTSPQWLTTQAEAPVDQPIAQEKLQAFAEALPSAVRSLLHQRYLNDALLLSPDQKALAAALAKTETNHKDVDFSHIGSVVPQPLLTVLTMTYNHEKYIAKCMESVLLQKTKFPVRHLVLDHASTDATPAIVADFADKYPSIVPVLLSKRASLENVLGLFLRCRSTYVALCDGDDYFTHRLKLQKQVEYLEKNKDCALCAHPVLVDFEDDAAQNYIYPPLSLVPQGFDAQYPLEQLFEGNLIQTNSVVYRWRFTEGLPSWFRADLCPGDWYWHILDAEMGKLGFLPDVMSVYRRHHDAMYYATHISQVEHRKIYGMAELKTYKVCNEHFKGKYFEKFAALANSVFANFLQISLEEDDNTLLTEAAEKFPEFAQFFLQNVHLYSEPPDMPPSPADGGA